MRISGKRRNTRFIRDFNAAPNTNRFNSFTNNCADFARDILNSYFPGTAHADHVNDFGMTSPKRVAKSVTKYGDKHPDLQFVTEKHSQINGSIRVSSAADARLYLTRATILGPGSDHWMAYRLLLAKVDDTLRAPRKNRENAAEFRATRSLLQQVSTWAPGMMDVSSVGQ